MPENSEPFIAVVSAREIGIVQSLWREYWRSQQLPDEFQSFGEEIITLPGPYAPPRGRLLIAYLQNDLAGTAALRPIDENSCEAKRLYVCPQYRGRGIGRALLRHLVEEARLAGYRDMYADTLESMAQALDMYKRFGFHEMPPYSANPTPGAIYLKLSLETRPAPLPTDW